MNPPTIWAILGTKDLGLFFEGTYDQFEDCYGGSGLPPDASDDDKEAHIVGWVLRWNAREKDAAFHLAVYRRVDTTYSLPIS